MPITALPPAPSRQDPDNFIVKADAMLSALPAFATEANALADEVNAKAQEVDADAAAAAIASAAAVAAANYKGPWSSLTGALNKPASVSHTGGTIWLLLNNLANVAASQPGVTGDWLQLTPQSGTLTGALEYAPQSAVASAATCNIGAAASNRVSVTGTTSITSFGTAAVGVIRVVTFSGVLTLTHNAVSLILPGGLSITTAAGDAACFESLGSGSWKCLWYQPLSVSPVGREAVVVVGVSTAAARSTTYVLTASITLTLPASPLAGDWAAAVNRSGTLTCVIARNGQNIMGLAEDLTLDSTNASVRLVFADATRGWVFA